MVTKTFDNFCEAYNEFHLRHFDIFQIWGNSLVGKLIGKAPEDLEEHLKTRPTITKQGKLWIVEGDCYFYCNKAFYNMAAFDSLKISAKASAAIAVLRYGVPEREIYSFEGETHFDKIAFSYSSIEDGIPYNGGGRPMEYPPTKEDISYVRGQIKKDLRRKFNQVKVVVSRPELVGFFKFDKIKGIELVVSKDAD